MGLNTKKPTCPGCYATVKGLYAREGKKGLMKKSDYNICPRCGKLVDDAGNVVYDPRGSE